MREDKAFKFYKLALFQDELFSKDIHKKVCALLIAAEPYQMLPAFYNGMSWGINKKYKYIVHAETNGIFNACRNGNPLKDSICVITMFPCSNCTKALIQLGVFNFFKTQMY